MHQVYKSTNLSYGATIYVTIAAKHSKRDGRTFCTIDLSDHELT